MSAASPDTTGAAAELPQKFVSAPPAAATTEQPGAGTPAEAPLVDQAYGRSCSSTPTTLITPGYDAG